MTDWGSTPSIYMGGRDRKGLFTFTFHSLHGALNQHRIGTGGVGAFMRIIKHWTTREEVIQRRCSGLVFSSLENLCYAAGFAGDREAYFVGTRRFSSSGQF